MNYLTSARRYPTQTGFSILEALVTLVVISAGLLGLAGLQTTLTREADASRQRGEATRLAQERIETIRSYNQLSSVSGNIEWNTFSWGMKFGWQDLPASGIVVSESVPGVNTTYTRQWTLGGTSDDPMRPLRITVSWTDRSGITPDLNINNSSPNKIIINSVIAKNDAAMSGGLTFSVPISGASGMKMLKNRHMNIPFPAHDLGNGESSIQLTDKKAGNLFSIVFSNQYGSVVRQCPTKDVITSATDAENKCMKLEDQGRVAYVVAGYIYNSTSTWPSNISLKAITPGQGDDSKCHLKDAENQNTGAIIASYRYYLCVIFVPENNPKWNGSIYLAGLANSDNRVCRYQYMSAAVTENEQNRQPYTNVGMSLDNQNYIINTIGKSTVTDACTPPLAVDPSIAIIKPHQYCPKLIGSAQSNCPSV